MMHLPPGVTVNYFIAFELDTLTDEMCEWFELIGGKVTEEEWWDNKGRRQTAKYVQYGKGKRSYRRQDGTNGTRLQFHGDDATTASVFLIKFLDHVQQHNFKEYQQYV